MTKREFLDTVFALAPNEANAIMDAFDEYVESNVVPTGRSGKERRMSKYIIEIPDDTRRIWIDVFGEGYCYAQAKGVDDLEELNSDYINEHYGSLQDEAYKQGYADAERIWRAPSSDNEFYQKGLEDGKKSTEKGCDGCEHENQKEGASPCCECARVCDDHYIPKRSDRIEVGDEVVFEAEGAETFVILHKYYDDAGYPSEYRYSVYAQNGEVLTFNEGDGPKKTGRHFQETNKLLEAMRQ